MSDSKSQTPEVKPLRPLTRKQAAFVKHLVDNPKDSATEAARATYNTNSDNGASQIATDNLRKPQVVAELAKYSHTAEVTLVEVMKHSKDKMYSDERNGDRWAVNARQTADSILDRLHGKAKQTTEVQQKSVNINIDLTAVS